MPSDLSIYKVAKGDPNASAPFDNFIDAVQALFNDIGGGTLNTFSDGRIFDPAQIKQGGATVGQLLAWGDYGSAVFTDVPKGVWPFNEAAGTLNDASGGAHNGTPVGGITYLAEGVRGGAALQFDGGATSVEVADHADFDTADVFSLEAWVKLTQPVAHTGIIIEKGGAYRLEIDTGDNKLHFWALGLGHLCSSTIAFPVDSEFHHVVATKNGATVKLYIDKVDVTSAVTNQTIGNSAIGIGIGGAQNADPNLGLRGYIDEPAIYATALSAARVTAHYDAAFWQGKTVAGGSGTIITDTELTSDAKFTFASIPGAYKHLILACYLRSDRAGTNQDNLALRFNNDTGATSYDAYTSELRGNLIKQGSDQEGIDHLEYANILPAATADTGSYAPVYLVIPHYAGTANNKVVIGWGTCKRTSTSGSILIQKFSGFWRNNSAITEIDVYPFQGTNLKAGSRATLIGVG